MQVRQYKLQLTSVHLYLSRGAHSLIGACTKKRNNTGDSPQPHKISSREIQVAYNQQVTVNYSLRALIL